VIQEFILAREVQFVTTSGIIPTQLFHDAVNCLLEPDERASYKNSHPFNVNIREFFAVARFMSRMFSFRHQRSTLRDNQVAARQEIPIMSLTTCLLELSRGRKCKDPRDYLCAMLALAKDDLGITPDYTLSLSSLLNKFALRSLKTRELSVLHASGIRPNRGVNLASFAPSVEDWDNMTLPLNASELQFSAATDCSVTTTTISTTAIAIRGTRVDKISRTTKHPGQQNNYELNAWLGRHYTVVKPYKIWRVDELGYPYPYVNHALNQVRIMGVYEPLCYLESHRSSNSQNLDARYVIVKPYLQRRKLFETSQGYLGIGPFWMEPDDQVVIFDGGITPFILRKVVSEDGEQSDTWQLVGDCFLLGWMKGDYFGHTVVDEIPIGVDNEGEKAGSEDVKHLVRESFTLV
jgi:hypothetical protein